MAIYYPHSIEIVAGSIDSGDVRSVRVEDDVFLTVNEVALTPGFDILFKFKKIKPPKYAYTILANIIGFYEGDPGHEVKLYMYNFITEVYDEMTANSKDMEDDSAKVTYEFPIDGVGHYSGFPGPSEDAEIWLQVKHVTAGNASHDIHFDQVYLDFSSHDIAPL